jgi:PHD/YefM family antitoxin component YafN of YafNO toxin-antitoxin module
MTYTATATRTTTTTEARVRAVMQKVAANFAAFVVARHVEPAQVLRWADDLIYLQVEEALDFFELQIEVPNGGRFGLRYVVSSDGLVQQDSASGGLDVYGMPTGTKVALYAHLRTGVRQYVNDELKRRGWGFNGRKLDAPESEQRTFSSGGYGLTRVKLGTWP